MIEQQVLSCPQEALDLATGDAGYFHSMHTGSVVDGPGVRVVMWTTGCPLRCQYCHNPDTWKLKHGRLVRTEEVVRDVLKYRRFMKVTGGGLTISGGEPLLQAPFVGRIFSACKAEGIHTALDTSGYLGDRMTDEDLEAIDLVLLDIKAYDPELHRTVTGRDVAPVLRFAERLARLGKPTWIRHVLVPGLTDDVAHVDALASFVATLKNVERVEVLPFHQMGRAKWEELGREYPLKDAVPPSPRRLARVVEQFRSQGLPAY